MAPVGILFKHWRHLVCAVVQKDDARDCTHLVDDAKRFAELLDTAQITVIAVAVLADRDVEFNLVILVVRCDFSNVPRDAATTEHDSAERVIEGLLRGHNTNANRSLLPNTVASDNLLDLVDTRGKLGGPLVDILEHAMGEVECNTTGADIRGVEAGARDALVELHKLLALLETPQERRQGTDIHGVGEDGHQV